LNIASALLKQVLEQRDFECWGNLRKHYLPSEYHTLFNIIDKHCEKNHALPTFEELKFGIRDAQTRAKLYAVETIEVDVSAQLLLDYLKNEYTQREILGQLEIYVDSSIAFETAEESLASLHQIIIDVEQKVDIKDPSETMERITLFESDEELSKYITLGLNSDYDSEFKFSPIDFILIGGRRGAGKSITCANLVVNARNAGKASIYFTIEMDSRQILQRICSMDTAIPLGRLRVKNLSVTEWEIAAKWWCARKEHGEFHYKEYLKHRDWDKLHNSLLREKLLPGQIHIIYDPSLTLAKINSEVARVLSLEGDIALVVVDYLNQVRRSNLPGKQYDWTEQIEVSKAIKLMAQEYKFPFISPYQIDATGEARFSKGILDAADAAFIMETHDHADGCITFKCTKMRGQEEKDFTSEMDWNTLKIGPGSKEPPKEKEATKIGKKKKTDEVEKSTESIDEELPF
jgi:replicative DNA helicase